MPQETYEPRQQYHVRPESLHPGLRVVHKLVALDTYAPHDIKLLFSDIDLGDKLVTPEVAEAYEQRMIELGEMVRREILNAVRKKPLPASTSGSKVIWLGPAYREYGL